MGERYWKGITACKNTTRAPFMHSSTHISWYAWKAFEVEENGELWRARKMVGASPASQAPFPSCTHARTSASMRGGRLNGKRTGNYGPRENDGRFPSFSRTLHVLARVCQLVCVEGIWRGSEQGIIARKNRMGGSPPLHPLYTRARLSLVSLSIPLNACRAGYRSAFSRVAIFTRLLAQMAHSDIPEKVRYYS